MFNKLKFLINILSGIASMMSQNAQSTPSINSSSSQSQEAVEEPVLELDLEVVKKINMKCKNILLEYEEMQNLDVCI